jgi:hypothetical protein
LIAVCALCAFTAAPLIADWCAGKCETARQAGVPACHHAGSAARRIEHEPLPCGHDHHPILVDTTAVKPPVARPLALHIADLSEPSSRVMGEWQRDVTVRGPTRSSPSLPLTLSSALRI